MKSICGGERVAGQVFFGMTGRGTSLLLEAAGVGFALSPHRCLTTIRATHQHPVGKRKCNTTDMKNYFFNKEFLKDALLFLGVLCLFYLIYMAVEYWPEIVQGFNRGWNGE